MDLLQIDIYENEIFERSPELLSMLLIDRTLSSENCQVNIFWATNNYANFGDGYQYSDQITLEAITGKNGDVIKPRAVKSLEMQQQRSREMAEVFTPSWICNKQNNLIDNAWFGRENVFNVEIDNPDGSHSWIPTEGKIVFPEGKTWHDYINENRLEITCGEAPYLVSRYDSVTQSAYMSVYGYEWQGDNLVLARESLLYTFIDYYKAKFGKKPQLKSLQYIASIISWNIWQMDGLKGVIPGSCRRVQQTVQDLFDSSVTIQECEGCQKGNIFKHNGIYCEIKDWNSNKTLTFISLLKGKK